MNDEKSSNTDKEYQKVKIADVYHQIDPLPLPCVCSAEDLAQATDSSQIEKMAPPDIANSMLEMILSFENKLNHAFNSPPVSIKKEEPKYPNNITQVEVHGLDRLPELTQSLSLSSSISAEFGYHDLIPINISIKPCTISKYKFLHPLQSPADFNGSISEISQLALTTQRALKLKHKCSVIPLPSSSLLRIDGAKKRLWFNNSNDLQNELFELSTTMLHFIQYLKDIVMKASSQLDIQFSVSDEIQLAMLIPKTNMSEIDDLWYQSTIKILSLSNICLMYLSSCGKEVYN